MTPCAGSNLYKSDLKKKKKKPPNFNENPIKIKDDENTNAIGKKLSKVLKYAKCSSVEGKISKFTKIDIIKKIEPIKLNQK